MCDRAAVEPARVWPPFHTTTGLRAAAARRERTKRRPSRAPSMYIAMIRVPASAAR